MPTPQTFRHTRTFGLSSWRGTVEELQGIAYAVIEAMEIARTTALTKQEAQVYQKYATDLAQPPSELGIADVATLDPNSEGSLYAIRSQELWRSTQQAIENARLWIITGHNFSWTLRGGVQESRTTPDIVAEASRQVAGVSIQSNVFGSPTALISVQLQNWPYLWLQLDSKWKFRII
jgi:hypothetical protein